MAEKATVHRVGGKKGVGQNESNHLSDPRHRTRTIPTIKVQKIRANDACELTAAFVLKSEYAWYCIIDVVSFAFR